ncbi:MAG: type II toxin-antitoxin system VapC family toxin [Chloroflexota bacterium]
MILLLDAHVVLWAVSEPEALAAAARTAIESPSNDVVVSAGSIWELEIKRALGKLRVEVELLQELERVGFSVLPITAADAISAARLAAHHRDPFDRMLVAQASRLGAVVVTRDSMFSRYEIEILPA